MLDVWKRAMERRFSLSRVARSPSETQGNRAISANRVPVSLHMPTRSSPALNSITSFKGDFAFLSNFFPSPIPVGDLVAPTAEHGFQMLKTDDPEERTWVCEAASPALAKRRGRKVTMRPDWVQARLEAMEAVLRLKFSPGSELAAKLLATGDAELVEGNAWGDQFWGVSRGRGQNHLGRLLIRVRAGLAAARP